MRINDQGSVVLFIPESDEEREFLKNETDNEPWQWLGNGLVVDHRMAEGLVEFLQEEGGFTVQGG